MFGKEMNGVFHLLDLVSQGRAVERHLIGLAASEKLEWLSARGKLKPKSKEYPFEEQSYSFESVTGRKCFFFFKNDNFVFIGDHTTFLGPEEREK